MQFKKNRALHRLVLAYILLLLLPITAGTVMMISAYTFNVKADYLHKSAERLADIDKNLSTVMQSLNGAVTKIRRDDNLAVYKLRKNAYYLWIAQQQLTRYLSTNPSLLDLVYYDEQKHIILSASESYSPDTFYATYYSDSGIRSETLRQIIGESGDSTISQPLLTTVLGGRTILTYTFTLPCADLTSCPRLLILVDTDILLSQMEASLPTENSTAFVMDTQSKPLLSTGELSAGELEIAESLLGGETDSREVRSIGSFVAYKPSATPGWHFYLMTPRSDVTRQITVFLFLLLGVEALILLASALFFGFNIKYYYKPLHTLGNLVRKQTHRDSSSESEYEVISSALSEISELRQQVIKNEEATFKLLLVQLILGRAADGSDGKTYHLFPTGWDVDSADNFFCLILLLPLDSVDSGGTAALHEAVQQHVSSLFVEDLSSDGLLILCPFDGKRNALTRRLAQAQAQLSGEHGLQTCAYISRTYHSVMDTSQIYKEVGGTAARRRPTPETPLIYCDNAGTDSPLSVIDAYPMELLADFREALAQEKLPEVRQDLIKIADVIRQESCGMSYARFLCYDVIYSVLYSLHGRKAHAFSGNGFLQEVERMLDVTTKEQLLEQLAGLDSLLAGQPAAGPAYEKQAIRYMEEHFAEVNFSIQSVADYLGISSSHLSRAFKAAVGCTLIEYVNQLRIERAKLLLAETEDPLSEIVRQIGYVDVSSFHKKFKAAVGMTPGAYRAQCRE